jgi:hypothetical protein
VGKFIDAHGKDPALLASQVRHQPGIRDPVLLLTMLMMQQTTVAELTSTHRPDLCTSS